MNKIVILCIPLTEYSVIDFELIMIKSKLSFNLKCLNLELSVDKSYFYSIFYEYEEGNYLYSFILGSFNVQVARVNVV